MQETIGKTLAVIIIMSFLFIPIYITHRFGMLSGWLCLSTMAFLITLLSEIK